MKETDQSKRKDTTKFHTEGENIWHQKYEVDSYFEPEFPLDGMNSISGNDYYKLFGRPCVIEGREVRDIDRIKIVDASGGVGVQPDNYGRRHVVATVTDPKDDSKVVHLLVSPGDGNPVVTDVDKGIRYHEPHSWGIIVRWNISSEVLWGPDPWSLH